MWTETTRDRQALRCDDRLCRLAPTLGRVERTLAWLSRNRRLTKDFEASLQSTLAWLFLASVKLFVRRLGRSIHAHGVI